MGKITDEMIKISYEYGKKYAKGDISLQDACVGVTKKSGMNKGSAQRSLQNMKCLLNEENYFYTMSKSETIWKLEKIKEDYGQDKFLRVLKIVEKHLDTKKTPNTKIREYVKQNKKSYDKN